MLFDDGGSSSEEDNWLKGAVSEAIVRSHKYLLVLKPANAERGFSAAEAQEVHRNGLILRRVRPPPLFEVQQATFVSTKARDSFPEPVTRSAYGCRHGLVSISGSALPKRIGGDGAFQLGPDMCRITQRSGGDHDAAGGAALDVAGHLMEVVVTDGRHVIIGDA